MAIPDKVFREVGGVGPVTGQSGLGSVRAVATEPGRVSRLVLTTSGPREGVGTGERPKRRSAPWCRVVAAGSRSGDLDPGRGGRQKIRRSIAARWLFATKRRSRNATLAGRSRCAFSVNSVGKVSHVEIEVDTMHDDDFAKCIVERAQSWRFQQGWRRRSPVPPIRSSSSRRIAGTAMIPSLLMLDSHRAAAASQRLAS